MSSTNTSTARSASGATSQGILAGRIMEIGSGMNYWDGQKWSSSDATLEVSPEGDAFVANRLCYRRIAMVP